MLTRERSCMEIIPPIHWPMMTEGQLWAVIIAFVMMTLDIASGFVGACIRHDVQSSKMREGLGHKALLVIIIAASYVLNVGFGHVTSTNISIPSVETVCVLIVVMEISSIIENVGAAWPEFSSTKLYQYFEKALKEGGDYGSK